MTLQKSDPAFLRYTAHSIKWNNDEYELFRSKCNHFAATYVHGDGNARVLSESLGAKLREEANIAEKMTEQQIDTMDRVITKWFYNHWQKHADMTKYIPPAPKNVSFHTAVRVKSRPKSTPSVTLESQAKNLACEMWSNDNSSWQPTLDKYVALGMDCEPARSQAIFHCFANLSNEDRKIWTDIAQVKIEEENRPLTKEEIAEHGNYFLVHYFNGTSQRLNVWGSPAFQPMLSSDESRSIDRAISKLIAAEYGDQLIPAWASDAPPKPEVYHDPDSSMGRYPLLPPGVDNAMERRRHLSTLFKMVLIGQGSNESRVLYMRIQKEHGVFNYGTVAAHYLVLDIPFCSPHDLKVEHVNQVWDTYSVRQARGQVLIMFNMVVCDLSTQKVPGYHMFISNNVDENESTIFYPKPIYDLPFSNRVKYSKDSESYARWLLQVIPETDAEWAEAPEPAVLEPSSDTESNTEDFDNDRQTNHEEPAVDLTGSNSDIKDDLASVHSTADMQKPVSESTSVIEQFSDSEAEDADLTVTKDIPEPQGDDLSAPSDPPVAASNDQTPSLEDAVQALGFPDFESSALNQELLDSMDPNDMMGVYRTAINSLDNENTRAELMRTPPDACARDVVPAVTELDASVPASTASIASLEHAVLNLDDHPLPIKCPDDWDKTMLALNEDMQEVPDALAAAWAPVVAEWHAFEAAATTHGCIRPESKGHLRPRSSCFNPPALKEAQQIGRTKDERVSKVTDMDIGCEIRQYYVAMQPIHRRGAMTKDMNFYLLTGPIGTEEDWNLIAFGGEFGIVVLLKLILYWGTDFHDLGLGVSDWMTIVEDLAPVLRCMTEFVQWKFKAKAKTPAVRLPAPHVAQTMPAGSSTVPRVAKRKLTQLSPAKPDQFGSLSTPGASGSQQPQHEAAKPCKSTKRNKVADGNESTVL